MKIHICEKRFLLSSFSFPSSPFILLFFFSSFSFLSFSPSSFFSYFISSFFISSFSNSSSFYYSSFSFISFFLLLLILGITVGVLEIVLTLCEPLLVLCLVLAPYRAGQGGTEVVLCKALQEFSSFRFLFDFWFLNDYFRNISVKLCSLKKCFGSVSFSSPIYVTY